MPIIEPFVRWAGGKSWLIPYLTQLVSSIKFNHFHEPFLGGGAVFLALDHERTAYLSDINEDLINAYKEIKNNYVQVINILHAYKNTEEDYYRIRSLILDDPIERAARFIYLNHTSYNGLYRVNKLGNYNVPYGRRKKINFNETKLKIISLKLQKANLKCGDFEINKYAIKKKDLVFLDPPYTVSHNNNGFIEYNKTLFSLDDQIRLSNFIEYIKHKEAYYILTNAAHPKIKEIFGKENMPIVLQRNSLIGGKNSKRQKIEEYIFTNIERG